MADLYGVIGYPLGHTLSPVFQQAAFDALGLDASYQALPTPPEGLAARIEAVREGRLAGLNVTIPHKTRIVELLDGTRPTAAAAGAVNTVFWGDGKLLGENTDVPAFRQVLDAAAIPAHERALLIGGGGAARAALYALLQRGHEVTMANRTPANAVAAWEAVAPGEWPQVLALDAPDLPATARTCGLIVNTTSVGMAGGPEPTSSPLPEGCLTAGQTVFDIVYRPAVTPLLAAALVAGGRCIGGLEMLVFQGALSFELWTGRKAPLDVMLRAARDELEAGERSR